MTTDVDTDTDTAWRRLDPRMLVITPVSSLVRLLPAFAVLLLTGREGDLSRVWFSIGGAAIIVILGVLRWRFTQYRVTADRVELHSGWLRRQRRSVPRDRIRTVDLTARLEHRIFGLSVVKVGSATGGTGEQPGLSLDAVSRAEAERLRRELLDRSPVSAAATTPAATELARLNWAWLRFAPLTFSSLAGVGVVAGAVFNLLSELGVSPRAVAGDAVDRLVREGVATAVGLVGITVLLAAVFGSVLLFVARWSGYRLTREPDRTLRVTRGLLTRRSLSVSLARLRGVEIAEPMLLRVGRGAQTSALSAGLTKDAQGGVLQPPVPRAEAHRVASAVAGAAPEEITGAPLRRHPAAAARRRVTRALGPTAVLVVVSVPAGRARRRPVHTRAAAGDGVGRMGPRPRAGAHPHPRLPRHPPRFGRAPHRRVAAQRRDRLAGPAEPIPALGGRRHSGGRHRGGARRLPRDRHGAARRGRGDGRGDAGGHRADPHVTATGTPSVSGLRS